MTDSKTNNSTPNTISVAAARQAEAVGREVVLQGWVRTRRDSKAGFSFLEINDGSCFGNIQVIAEASLPNYESEIKRLSPGCSVSVTGLIKASPGKGQATEVQATSITVCGLADVETYPLQRERPLVRVSTHHRPSAAKDEHVRRRRSGAELRVQLDPSIFSRAGLFYMFTRR